MISDVRQGCTVSTLPWLDGGSLYRCDLESRQVEKYRFSGARYLTLYAGNNGLFVAVHTYLASKVRWTIHRIDSPDPPVAWYELEDGRHSSGGDEAAFSSVPRSYTSYYSDGTKSGFCLFVREKEALKFHFWNDPIDRTGSIDGPDQDYVAACDVPGFDTAVIGTQRASQLYVLDLNTGRQIRTVKLAGRFGNIIPFAIPSRDEIWTVDSDTAVKIKLPGWSIETTPPLERPDRGYNRFVGRISFSCDRTHAFIARPFSRDVITISTDSLEVLRSTTFDCQPIDGFIGKDTAVARDWKTGQFAFNNQIL